MAEPTPKDTPTPEDQVEHTRMTWGLVRLVGPGMLAIVLCIVASYVVPMPAWVEEEIGDIRPWTTEDPVPFWNLIGRPFASEEEKARQEKQEEVEDFAREVLAEDDPKPLVREDPEVVQLDEGDKRPAYEPKPGDDAEVQQSIELFEGNELDSFLAALADSDSAIEGATTRVIHWGDSAIGLDGIPSAIRRRMQARFGDGGHGFHLMAPPNTSYLHREVYFRHNETWEGCFIIRRCKRDGRYGLGGFTTWSYGGAKSRFKPSEKNSSGRVGRFDIYYLAQPKGGVLKLSIDKGEEIEVDTETEGDLVEDRVHSIQVEDGMHELSVRAGGSGQARVYGVVMEREVPGVVWDGAALVGAFTNRFNAFDETHLQEQLEHRDADLAVFMFGGNDMVRDSLTEESYYQEYRKILQHLRKADPELACLVMTPLDHGDRQGSRIVSRPIVPIIVEAQRRAAKEEGCAFFDTFSAMGGEGSAGRWYNQEPRLIGGDYSHATGAGHKVIGEMLYRALLEQYVAFRKRDG